LPLPRGAGEGWGGGESCATPFLTSPRRWGKESPDYSLTFSARMYPRFFVGVSQTSFIVTCGGRVAT
jgi:hypothetical protein